MRNFQTVSFATNLQQFYYVMVKYPVQKLFVARNMIARLCITSVWPYDAPWDWMVCQKTLAPEVTHI